MKHIIFHVSKKVTADSAGEHNHTGIQPLHLFPIKEDYTTGKAERLHSEKSKQTIEADCRFGSEISNYLSTALKG